MIAGLLLLLLPVLAQAETAVVYDSTLTEADVRAAWLQQEGREVAVRFVSVDAIFDPASPAVLLGDAAAVPCAGEPATAADLDTLNQSVQFLSLEMDYLAATAALRDIELLLPCLVEVPGNDALSRYHFMRGLIAWHADGEATATRRFEEALLTAPLLQWDPRHPPQVRPAWDRALEGALAAETAFFSVSPGVIEAGTFWVDGRALDRRTRTATLYEGTHLLQWTPDSGAGRSWLVPVTGGQFVTLVARADAIRSLVEGQADPGVTAYALQQALAPVELQSGGQLAVAQDLDLVLFHEYDAAAGRWRLADVEALERWRRNGRTMRDVGIGLSVGGALLGGTGLVLALEGSNKASGLSAGVFEGDGAPFGERELLDDIAADYNAARERHGLGVVLGAVGFSFTITGVPLSALGAQRARAQQASRRRR